jgi:hypothetical protein
MTGEISFNLQPVVFSNQSTLIKIQNKIIQQITWKNDLDIENNGLRPRKQCLW